MLECRVVTLDAGRLPDETVDASCLDNRLLINSSRVSCPVFFDLGELIADVTPSRKAELVLILSEDAKILRGIADNTVPCKSRLLDDVLVPEDMKMEVGW